MAAFVAVNDNEDDDDEMMLAAIDYDYYGLNFLHDNSDANEMMLSISMATVVILRLLLLMMVVVEVILDVATLIVHDHSVHADDNDGYDDHH